MMLASSTPYSSVPQMPSVHAMPGGIPQGPWGPLYRAAPGAQLHATRYPGMRGAALAGLGASPVQIVGALGQDATLTKSQKFGSLMFGAALSAGFGAGLAYTLKSRSAVRNTALFTGGLTLVGGVLSIVLAGA